jgi:hypothetical protein
MKILSPPQKKIIIMENTIVSTDQDLLKFLRTTFKEDAELIEHLAKIEEKKDYYELIPATFFYSYQKKEELEKIFNVLNKGKEVLPRLMEIYAATEGSEYSYFIPNYKNVTKNEVSLLMQQYLQNLLQMIQLMEDDYSTDFLEELKKSPPQIEIIKGEGPKSSPSDDDEFEGSVYELQHEFIYSLDEDFLADRFSEALYQMACSYDIVHFVLWPYYEKNSKIKDPFRTLIELWKIGADLKFDYTRNTILVYVPNLTS